MYENWLTLLLNTPLFTDIQGEEAVSLLECLKPQVRSFDPGAFIAFSGDEIRHIGVVLYGRIEVMKDNIVGQPLVVVQLGRGAIFGEVAAFSAKRIWPSSVRASRQTQILWMGASHFSGHCEKGCSSHRQLMSNMLGILASKALLLDQKVALLSMKTLRGKIATLLYEQRQQHKAANFSLPYDRKEMAEQLHVARPSLSRELAVMRQEGIIDFRRSEFHILDEERLKACLS
jgi:CRP/FNR family transcriptional regulator, dissimilatory nitrate respiration regulator